MACKGQFAAANSGDLPLQLRRKHCVNMSSVEEEVLNEESTYPQEGPGGLFSSPSVSTPREDVDEKSVTGNTRQRLKLEDIARSDVVNAEVCILLY